MGMIRSVLINQGFLKAETEVDEFLQDNEISEDSLVQKLIFDKTVFTTPEEAKDWAQSHGFFTGDTEETDTGFEIEQFDESEFIKETLKTVELRRGVRAQVGILKMMASEDPFILSLRNDDTIKLSGDMPHIIELAKVAKGFHGRFGEVEITPQDLKSMEMNFNDGVTGVDIMIDFDHEVRGAAGWIRSVWTTPEGNVLLGEIKWTPKGALSLSDREFRYFSPEFTKNFVNPITTKAHGTTLVGGALVNRPFLRMDAIVSLKDKQSKQEGKKMETISLADHNVKVSGLETQISEFKLSEEKTKHVVEGMKTENTKLSDRVKELEEVQAKAVKEAKHQKLFDDGKICKAQLVALNEDKDMVEVLSLSEHINTKAKGGTGENDTVQLSDEDVAVAGKIGMSVEDFAKYSPPQEGRL